MERTKQELKIMGNTGLWRWQKDRLHKEAEIRGISDNAILRTAVSDWLNMLDSARETRVPEREEDLLHQEIVERKS